MSSLTSTSHVRAGLVDVYIVSCRHCDAQEVICEYTDNSGTVVAEIPKMVLTGKLNPRSIARAATQWLRDMGANV